MIRKTRLTYYLHKMVSASRFPEYHYLVKGYVEHTSCAATDDGASFVALNFGDSSKDIIMLLFSSATGEAVESEMIGIAG